MTAPMLTTEHPTEETLAAYVDDRLDSATRREATEHLASCGECREIVLMATDFQVSEETSNVRTGTFGRRGWMAAAGLAAAAAIAVFVVQPSASDIDNIVVASRSMKTRISMGRLAGFAYNDQPRTNRGAGDKSDDSYELLTIRADLSEKKSPDPHAFGLALLQTATSGKDIKGDLTAAVEWMEKALKSAPAEDRDAVEIDLATGLIARAGWVSMEESEKDYGRALDLSNDVLKRTQRPEALWNRAIALGLLDKSDEALKAWDDYLKVDPTSQWAEEAKRHKAALLPYQ